MLKKEMVHLYRIYREEKSICEFNQLRRGWKMYKTRLGYVRIILNIEKYDAVSFHDIKGEC